MLVLHVRPERDLQARLTQNGGQLEDTVVCIVQRTRATWPQAISTAEIQEAK